MEPMYGLILILAWGGLNALIASKRKRSGLAFFGWSVLPVIPVFAIVARLTAGDDTMTGWSAFIPPAVTFIAAIVVVNGREAAARTGSFGAYVRCPFCAEPIRREAVKCRHCGSQLPTAISTPADDRQQA